MDYICVSNRWRSMARNVSVKWGPSEHRFGRKFDHSLVSAIWHWRTKKAAKFETPNFKDMDNQSWRRFDENLRIRIKSRQETRAKRAVTSVTPASTANLVRQNKHHESDKSNTTSVRQNLHHGSDKSNTTLVRQNLHHGSDKSNTTFSDNGGAVSGGAASGEATGDTANDTTNDAATATTCAGKKGSSEYAALVEDIRETIAETVPKKPNLFKNGRAVSEETKELYKQRRKEFSKSKTQNAATRKSWNKKIKNACRNDYRRWVSRWTDHIEKADAKGDLKAVHRGVRALSGAKNCLSHTQTTTDKKGQRLKSPKELASVWSRFLGRKFAATELESMRAEFENLPARVDGEGALTRTEFDEAVRRMKAHKATGIDGVPAEVWKHSELANEMLFEFLTKIWDKEEVPAELAVGIFVMIHKKNSPEACANYRCIGLLNHSYKIMTTILLLRLTVECASFFSDWQAGFRQQRGCRDNILLLRIIYDSIIRENKK